LSSLGTHFGVLEKPYTAMADLLGCVNFQAMTLLF